MATGAIMIATSVAASAASQGISKLMNKGSSSSVSPALFAGAGGGATGSPISLLPAGGGGGALATTGGLGPSPGFDFSKFFKENKGLIGGAVGGIGSGLLSRSKAEAAEEALLKRDRERRDQIDRNFSNLGPGLLQPRPPSNVDRPTPTEKFDPITSGAAFVYDPGRGRIVASQQEVVPGPG